MPMLTVRLDDDEMLAIKALAAPGSVAGMVKGWIAGGGPQPPQQAATPDVAPPPWKVIPSPEPPARDVHAQCRDAERRSWLREQDARKDYAAMLGILRTIATAKEQAPGSRRYLVYEDTMSAILAITDDVHERERQAAEFAVDMDEPF